MSVGFIKVFSLTLIILTGIYFSLQQWFIPVNDSNSKIQLNHIINSNFIESNHLFIFRLLSCMVIYLTSLVCICNPFAASIVVSQLDLSNRSLKMGGLTEFGTFTFWAWNLQGVYYLFTLYLHVLPDPSPLLIQTTVILFEVSFSVAILVTVVVTFVLIPVGIHMKEDVEGLFAPLALIMHNLNVIFMVLELIWNQIKFDLSHLPFVILFGLVYVIAAWFIAYSQGYFFYFFLNFNQPKCILLHLALVLALSLFYLISYFTTIWLNPEDNLLAIPVLLFGTWFICCIQSPEVKDLSTKSE